MNRRSDFTEGVFRPHSSAPDLGVVEEEELIVAQIQTCAPHHNNQKVIDEMHK
jgi:hypothetical protein